MTSRQTVTESAFSLKMLLCGMLAAVCYAPIAVGEPIPAEEPDWLTLASARAEEHSQQLAFLRIAPFTSTEDVASVLQEAIESLQVADKRAVAQQKQLAEERAR